jgi:ABC-type phosphate transport system substrate-binding protein
MFRQLGMLTMLALAMPAWADGIAVIAHPSTKASINREDLMRLYMGKSKSLSDGSPVMALYLKEGLPVRRAFDSQVLNRQPAQVKAYWAQQIFTGRGTPPPERVTETAMLESVATTPGTIGFISASAVTPSVKVLLTLP